MLTSETNKNDENLKNRINTASLTFLLIGITTFIAYFFQNLLGYSVGEEIVSNLRK
jgi:mannose/fructose/N-acetylgalactosamine-specific phosphotransferase system component IID